MKRGSNFPQPIVVIINIIKNYVELLLEYSFIADCISTQRSNRGESEILTVTIQNDSTQVKK